MFQSGFRSLRIFLPLIIVLAIVLVACGGDDDDDTDATSTTGQAAVTATTGDTAEATPSEADEVTPTEVAMEATPTEAVVEATPTEPEAEVTSTEAGSEATPTEAEADVEITDSANEGEIPADLDEAMQTALIEAVTPNDFDRYSPGGILIVQSPEWTYWESVGVADVEAGTPVTTDMRFEIGSITKTFTSVLALQLQEEGLIDLDDPLSDYLPEIAAELPNGADMTLRMLLNHTSGVYDYQNDVLYPALDSQEGLEKAWTPDEIIETVITVGTPTFAPGESWLYSNTGYILIGMVIESVTGENISDLYQERIFDVVGMPDTVFPTGIPEDEGVDENMMRGYYQTPFDLDMTRWNTSGGWAAGAIISDADDMIAYGEALFSGSLFADPASFDEMTDFVTEPADQFALYGFTGYGLGMIEYLSGAIGHDGQALGYEATLYTVPDTDIVVFASVNAAEGNLEAFHTLAFVIAADQ